jgi:hypothetical protein
MYLGHDIIINRKHKLPHIHVSYQGEEAVFGIPEGDILEGSIPKSKVKLVQAWIEIHKDELMADWELAIDGENIFKIDPLK